MRPWVLSSPQEMFSSWSRSCSWCWPPGAAGARPRPAWHPLDADLSPRHRRVWVCISVRPQGVPHTLKVRSINLHCFRHVRRFKIMSFDVWVWSASSQLSPWCPRQTELFLCVLLFHLFHWKFPNTYALTLHLLSIIHLTFYSTSIFFLSIISASGPLIFTFKVDMSHVLFKPPLSLSCSGYSWPKSWEWMI